MLFVVVKENPGRRHCFPHETFILNQFLRLSVFYVVSSSTVQDRPTTVQDRKMQSKYASSLRLADISVGIKFHSGSGLNKSFWWASNRGSMNTLVSMLFFVNRKSEAFFTHRLIHEFVFLECK